MPKQAPESNDAPPWHVYMVRTAADTLYTGIAVDVDRRFEEHCSGAGRGAKYLRGRGPLDLVYRCELGERGTAQRVEHALKQLTRADKEGIVAAHPNASALLARLALETAEEMAGGSPDVE